MNSYSVRPTRRNAWRAFFVVCVVMIMLAAVSIFVVRRMYNDNLRPVSATAQTKTVTIQSGSTAHDIALQLKEAGLIRAAWALEWYIRTNNLREKLQAGSYDFSQSQSVPQIVSDLVDGKISTNLVTILPAQRLDQIKKALIKSGFVESEVDAALNPALYAGHPALVDKPADADLEGYLYPDSYQKTADSKPETIIGASLDRMQQALTTDVRAGLVAQGLTVHQGVIFASIVEQEVSNPTDRPIVAQVFLKRFRTGMALGSDVTARYGAIKDGVSLPQNSAEADSIAIAHDSPYNTRMHPGLPPGPISNVSENSLRAVAFPSTTDYLYFVAGDDGTTHFSKTAQEHEEAAQKYCIKLCGR